ncbi:alpha/beta fold hydrolase [Thermoleophilia bacterium SCSIO 60948]|nr:alpha/beta fold hydrolase [Thermoleophilia bacterium SCSIO 60948]
MEVSGVAHSDVLVSEQGARFVAADGRTDAELCADLDTWRLIAEDLRSGMQAFSKGDLIVRKNLHLGVGFLSAVGGPRNDERRLRFRTIQTREARISSVAAGEGEPLICIHGLGATKASFLPTISALAEDYRVISIDLPGFGDSDKPIGADYDARYFSRVIIGVLDALEIDRAHLAGNSMGGRIALEVGLRHPERVGGLGLLSPALAWLRSRPWRFILQAPVGKLGLIQPTPRWVVDPIVRSFVPGSRQGWSAAGVDDFMRSYVTPRGRNAFYESARNIYMDEPHGDSGFWTRLSGLEPPAQFVWGRQDTLVPIAFMRHAEKALPNARHLELDCGHVPQLERPRQVHETLAAFYAEHSVPAVPPVL